MEKRGLQLPTVDFVQKKVKELEKFRNTSLKEEDVEKVVLHTFLIMQVFIYLFILFFYRLWKKSRDLERIQGIMPWRKVDWYEKGYNSCYLEIKNMQYYFIIFSIFHSILFVIIIIIIILGYGRARGWHREDKKFGREVAGTWRESRPAGQAEDKGPVCYKVLHLQSNVWTYVYVYFESIFLSILQLYQWEEQAKKCCSSRTCFEGNWKCIVFTFVNDSNSVYNVIAFKDVTNFGDCFCCLLFQIITSCHPHALRKGNVTIIKQVHSYWSQRGNDQFLWTSHPVGFCCHLPLNVIAKATSAIVTYTCPTLNGAITV